MKKLSIISSFCLMIVLALCFSACSLGGYHVTFVDYNGAIVGTEYYSYETSVTNENSPRTATREGYDFVRWTYENPSNIVPQEEVTTGSVMFAKYKLNKNSLIFEESGRRVDWHGETSSATTYFKAGQTKTILINDEAYSKNLSLVSVLASSGSNFSLADFKVYDADGYEITRNSSISNIWDVSPANNGTYSFALVITALYAGEATIQAS